MKISLDSNAFLDSVHIRGRYILRNSDSGKSWLEIRNLRKELKCKLRPVKLRSIYHFFPSKYASDTCRRCVYWRVIYEYKSSHGECTWFHTLSCLLGYVIQSPHIIYSRTKCYNASCKYEVEVFTAWNSHNQAGMFKCDAKYCLVILSMIAWTALFHDAQVSWWYSLNNRSEDTGTGLYELEHRPNRVDNWMLVAKTNGFEAVTILLNFVTCKQSIARKVIPSVDLFWNSLSSQTLSNDHK